MSSNINKYEKPKICCIDIDDDIAQNIINIGFSNLFKGTFGTIINKINFKNQYDEKYFHVDFLFPSNIQEYDIIIYDLTYSNNKDYTEEDTKIKATSATKITQLKCKYPTSIFNPKPLSSSFFGSKLNVRKNKFIQIVFACMGYSNKYRPISIHGSNIMDLESFENNIYDFWNKIPLLNTIEGQEVINVAKNNDIKIFLEKYKKDIKYYQTFSHPSYFEKTLFPFLTNNENEIISFALNEPNKISFVFPDIKDKKSFLEEFLINLLPSILPDFFPQSQLFKWINNEEYYLPNHNNIIIERNTIEENFKISIEENDKKLKENKLKYFFLHDLLTETDKKLVESLKKYLEWLGFKKVTIKDEIVDDILEEDIEIGLDNGLLIIEVKGIGGTSTDSDCSQISKIKHRRCEERTKFDVFALYIVNHQRFLPPNKRKNPPFTTQQIKDAYLDKRGLLTTYQLYNLYFDIENGIFTKEEVRKILLNFGIISFRPTVNNMIGITSEVLKDGSVFIINLNNTKIFKGQEIFIEKNDKFKKSKILSIQFNDKEIEEIESGEVGIKIDSNIKKGSKIWI
ncbi:MAG: hypothetical protein HY959_10090 [Ignavibacteriae bacterium]|nr:hypothetical protein [Ignavibacteriota bacterium]